ncbi:hypothetical protein ACF8EA_09700 [Pseudomonas sp. YQ_5]|uniref:hypothetical protein n=1 Tax=Pseudomonas sp. YQ_5 TaxID=3367229 RepID=UPI00370B961F
MLVKIPDMDDDVIAELKRTTGTRTGSRAVYLASLGYLEYHKICAEQDKEIADLRQKLAAAAQVIEGARSAAALLLEKTGQTELL